jgi:CRP-like cAMP-binding protein
MRSTPFLAGDPASEPARKMTPRQRQRLMAIATRERFPARTIIYREDSPAHDIFINTDGVVKAFRDLPSGRRRIVAFLLQGDLFGLAEGGRYMNTTQTVTPVTAYRVPLEALAALLRRDAELEFLFLCKVTHELREAQRQQIRLGRRDATGRLAMFVGALEAQSPEGGRGGVQVPMSRNDIADYLGLSPEAVSRAGSRLAKQNILAFEGRHLIRIVDRVRFAKLVQSL